jgi:hypothetical protein
MDDSRCDASSQRAARGRFVLEVSQLVALAICSQFSGSVLHAQVGPLVRGKFFCGRPGGAERVEYEGIPNSQRGGIHNNLVGIKNLRIKSHAPGLVANGTAAVLTRGLGTVTVAVKPSGWSSVRH